ncbi:hypothetical protein FC16_GL002319 [Loigolactobacillus coryniformis subsp. torquens DSM 20004 = KCTC 3535]|nr:hypothetical protein FC16_GL002319 [Loigolactobacillus coryniformis subsp. torquens DSM 20004 = KCTC 3535]
MVKLLLYGQSLLTCVEKASRFWAHSLGFFNHVYAKLAVKTNLTVKMQPSQK